MFIAGLEKISNIRNHSMYQLITSDGCGSSDARLDHSRGKYSGYKSARTVFIYSKQRTFLEFLEAGISCEEVCVMLDILLSWDRFSTKLTSRSPIGMVYSIIQDI